MVWSKGRIVLGNRCPRDNWYSNQQSVWGLEVRDAIPQKFSIRIQVAAAAALAINGFTKDKSYGWCVRFQLLERIPQDSV